MILLLQLMNQYWDIIITQSLELTSGLNLDVTVFYILKTQICIKRDVCYIVSRISIASRVGIFRFIILKGIKMKLQCHWLYLQIFRWSSFHFPVKQWLWNKRIHWPCQILGSQWARDMQYVFTTHLSEIKMCISTNVS